MESELVKDGRAMDLQADLRHLEGAMRAKGHGNARAELHLPAAGDLTIWLRTDGYNAFTCYGCQRDFAIAYGETFTDALAAAAKHVGAMRQHETLSMRPWFEASNEIAAPVAPASVPAA